MSKKLLFILIILSLMVSPASAQLNDNNQSEIRDIQINSSNLNYLDQENFKPIELEEIKGSNVDIDIYKAYETNISGTKSEWADISFSVNNSWIEEADSNDADIFVLNGPYKRYQYIERGKSNGNTTLLSSNVYVGIGNLIIGKSENIEEYLDVKTDGGNCGRYIDPFDNLSKVEDCRYNDGSLVSSASAFISNNIESFKSLGGAALILSTLLLVYILLNKLEKKLIEEKIERTTEKLIERKKSNQIDISQSVLRKLEIANEKAYSQKYDEAEEIIDKIGSKYLVTNVWRKEILFLLAFIGVAAFSLRILAIGSRVMWWDELFTWWLTKLRFTDSLTIIFNDVNPPFYYIVLRLWSLIVGSSEFAFRFLSLIFSILSIFYVFLIGKLLNVKAAIFSAILVMLSWYHVIYSVEIRFYALMSLLSLMSLYHLIQFLDKEDDRNKILYILSTVLLVYTHVYGFFIVLAQTIFLLWIYYNQNLDNKTIKAYISTIIGLIPLVAFYIYQKYYLFVTGEIDFWIRAPGIGDLIEAFEIFSGSSEILVLYLLLLGTSLYSLKSQESDKSENTNILLWLYLTISVIVPWIISYSVFPLFKARYLIMGAMAFYILAGYGLSKFSNFPLQILVLGIIVLVSSIALTEEVYQQEPNEPWDDVIEHVESDYNGESNVIYHGHWARFAFEKYGEKDIETQSIPKKHMYDPGDNYRFISTERTRIDRKDIDEIKPLIQNSKRTWLILSHEKGMTEELIIKLDESYENMEFYDYNGIKLYEFYN